MDWPSVTMYYVVANVVIMFLFTIVTTIGGGMNLFYMFNELRKKNVDEQLIILHYRLTNAFVKIGQRHRSLTSD